MLRTGQASHIARGASLATTVRLTGSHGARRGIANAPEPPPQTGSQNKKGADALKSSDPLAVDADVAPGVAKMPQKKTMEELDEELRQKMSGIAGDGGTAGVEYEDGKPVAMKRSVKNNMFRYI